MNKAVIIQLWRQGLQPKLLQGVDPELSGEDTGDQ